MHITITSEPALIAPVRKSIEEIARAHGFDEEAVGQIGLVVNEALANVIRHAYHEVAGKPIEVSAEFADDVLTIRMRDWGDGVNPMNFRRKGGADLLRPGGLGLVCMRKLMDELEFQPQKDGGMILEMKRHKGEVKHGC